MVRFNDVTALKFRKFNFPFPFFFTCCSGADFSREKRKAGKRRKLRSHLRYHQLHPTPTTSTTTSSPTQTTTTAAAEVITTAGVWYGTEPFSGTFFTVGCFVRRRKTNSQHLLYSSSGWHLRRFPPPRTTSKFLDIRQQRNKSNRVRTIDAFSLVLVLIIILLLVYVLE